MIQREAGVFELASAAGHERNTTGRYCTPISLVDCLDEAYAQKDPEAAILALTVCDPACGSGDFPVAAAWRMAHRLAAVRSGDDEPSPDDMRAALAGDHNVVKAIPQPIDCEVGRGLSLTDARGGLTLGAPWLRYDECHACGHFEVFIPEYHDSYEAGVVYRRLRIGHLQPPRPNSLARLTRFVGAEPSEVNP